jgi:hypothetical protein
MKSYFSALGLLIWLVLCVQPASAQRKAEPRKPQRTVVASTPQNVLKINPLSLFTLTTNVSYEGVLNAQMSGQLGFFYTFPSVTIAHTRFHGFGLTPEFRYYFAAVEAPKGFYLAPFLRYQRFTLTYDDPGNRQYNGEAIFRATGLGATLGGQWVFGNGFSVDAFFGFAANSFNIRTDVPGLSDKIKIPIPGVVSPRLGMTIGKAF